MPDHSIGACLTQSSPYEMPRRRLRAKEVMIKRFRALRAREIVIDYQEILFVAVTNGNEK
jgi:hypothetical protein